MIAKELMTKHNLKQEEAAKLLGVSQPAISFYRRKIRGKAIALEDDKEVGVLIENFAAILVTGTVSNKDFIRTFCEVCRTIRAKGLMCELHKAFDSSVDIEGCDLCTVMAAKCIS